MSKKKQQSAPEQEVVETTEPEVIDDGALDIETEENESVETLKKQLEEAVAQREEYLNLAQRVQADFENFRRRNNSVRAEAYEDGARNFIATILPVLLVAHRVCRDRMPQ